jgi:preprotein translocase YajC subunit
MNAEIILNCSIVVIAMIVLLILIQAIFGSRNLKARRAAVAKLQSELAVGQKVQFAGGFIGTIAHVEEHQVKIALNQQSVVDVERAAITAIL